MKQFNLSKNIELVDNVIHVLHVSDVKKFIKILKEKLCNCGSIFNPNNMDGECNLCQTINEFAGEKLK